MAQLSNSKSSAESVAKLVYNALPDINSVRQDWRCILQPFSKIVLAEKIFLSGGSRWIDLGEAIINRLDQSKEVRDEIRVVVLHTLLTAGQPIVSLPSHVLQVIDQFHQLSGWNVLQKVTPELLCDVLRSNFDFHALEMEFRDRLLVLEYALQCVPGNIAKLHGIPLLPLENRAFIKFSFPNVEKIFIPFEKHRADLLPNMKHRFLSSNLLPQVQQKLNQLGYTRTTQLFHPTAQDIKQLLWQNFPANWSYSSQQLITVTWNPQMARHPSLDWLELVWKWINEYYPRSLHEFEGMPLIPVSVRPPSSMARLRQNSSLIFGEHPLCNDSLSVSLRGLLQRSGCIVIENPQIFLKHDQLLTCIALPTPNGILSVLSMVKTKAIQELTAATNEVKLELCCILSKLNSLSPHQISFIFMLPIFEAVDGSHFVSCRTEYGEQRLVAPRNLFLPEGVRIIDKSTVLASFKDESYRLLKLLGVQIQSTASLIKIHLENFLSDPGIMNDEKDNLMLWILAKMDALNQEVPTFIQFIGQITCIPTASGKRKAPNQLFDHSDALLTQLLQGNNEAFPVNQFSELVRRRKHELKVRCRENFNAQDVVDIVNRSLNLQQSHALLELLNQRPQLLKERTTHGMFLFSILRDLQWLPRMQDRPADYPDFMPWYTGTSVCKSSDMYPNSLALLVGATAPVFDERSVRNEVQALLGMSKASVLAQVVDQLDLAINSWSNKTTFSPKATVANFEAMMKRIYMYLSEAPADTVQHLLQSKNLTRWLWHGSGFTSPERVALQSSFQDSFNLHPYLFILPNELFVVKEFLLSFGVRRVFQVDDLLDMLWNIKAKHDEEEQSPRDAMQDFDQCRAVLEWIVRSGGELTEKLRSKLLIPVQTKSDQLQLEPCNTCTYCDREFLRRGVSEHQISTKYHLIHKAIPDNLACRLRVPRLSGCIAGAKALGIQFKEAGQYEPLTTRLRNILQQYKEGVAIFKEIIQNADDAGASKVCFVVDWRENPGERLFTTELRNCQGPALWAYNDAMFSEKDFENINKLAGETKKAELNKVGRFGLGFNSVYHLTDVPSFVSGKHMVVFDPNMYHIASLIDRKHREGGVMLNLVESKDGLSSFPDQFSPYNHMFGCDMTGTDPFHFEGTLFRLPFRTSLQAQRSNISKEVYTEHNVINLIKSLKESASTLLLFTQKVKEVRVFEIQQNSNPKMSLGHSIISIKKSVEKILRSNKADMNGKGTILQNSSTWLLSCRSLKVEVEGPCRTELLKVNISMMKSKLSEVSNVAQVEDWWVVDSCTGGRSSMQVAGSADGLKNGVVPISGVAARISNSKTQGVEIFPVAGEVFCFMPLSIESGFPVHVNGSFSVYSDRRRLWEEGVGEHNAFKPFEARWNEALMEDPLVHGYLRLLQILTSFSGKQYEFHCLWPNPTKVNCPKAWKPFLHSFFNKIVDEEWPLFHCNGEWRRMQDCLILDPKLAKVTECISIMNLLGENVLSLPSEFTKAFRDSGKEDFIHRHLLTEARFLTDYFFPRVSDIPSKLRNSVLVHILDRRLKKHRDYDDLLQHYPSFTCHKDGKMLRRPSELVHPHGKAAGLFSVEENRFPVDEQFLEKERAFMLEELGMVIDRLSGNALCERAERISNLCDMKKAGLLVQYMNSMPRESEISQAETARLRAAKFLPILSKPADYPFPWKSNEHPSTQLAAADELYPDRHKYLVGCSQLILDELSNSSSVPNAITKKILGFSSKQPQIPDVIVQLDFFIQQSHQLFKERKESDMCFKIYEFLQRVAATEKHKGKQTYLRQELERRPWMLVQGQMVYPKFVARNWKKQGGSPYLFALPIEYTTKFNSLIRWYKIKETFGQDDFIGAVCKLREDTGRKKLLDSQISTLIVFLEEIFGANNTKPSVPLPLPSVDCQLYNADELGINESPWLETDGKTKLVHEKIPVMLAYKCGAKELRNADLTRCSEPIGQPFGQHEELIDRLKNILSSYPSDEGILKELLQNADDAKANEIHFVFDPRTHQSKHVFSDDWKDLQGPAICVYNDKPFSPEDIEGIQKLGIGSKVDDPLKTGQYGIGFNAVYHLTDCPYFISNDEVICVADPYMAYVPGATERNPGRLFNQLDGKFRRNYQDIFSGFLGNLFSLKGGTMFRFPLRCSNKFKTISSYQWNKDKVEKLFELFRGSAKMMLLFLNNVTKISVSQIKDGKLETYSVMCHVSEAGERAKFLDEIRAYSRVPTQQVPFRAIHYVMKISDTSGVKEDWLVTQSLGYILESGSVPDGYQMGLLPRAGIAARCPSNDSPRFRHSLFCVLPLPVSTKFPVHINGHFALDSARRDVWHDLKSSDKRVEWNNFMKRHVIAPAYACAIHHAKGHMLGYKADSCTFSSKKETDQGLKWYHQLFPIIADLDEKWKPVGEALYRHFISKLPVLPVASFVPERKKTLLHSLFYVVSSEDGEDIDVTPVSIKWCKADEAYFCTAEMSWSLETTLLGIGFRLLSHTPSKIHNSFKKVECCQDVSPEGVCNFLYHHGEIKDNLPVRVEATVFQNENNVCELTSYCAKGEHFYENLEGLPLLLTQDNVLRCFSQNAAVFCSRFSQLLFFRLDLFLHDKLRSLYVSKMKKCSNIILGFLVADLAKFQIQLFPRSWVNNASHHLPWNPTEVNDTVPSKEWLKLLWEFIDDIARKQGQDKQYENDMGTTLASIVSWHIIPTTNSCLAPVCMGKTVLNVSTYLNADSSRDKIRRELLVKLGCPQLDSKMLPLSFNQYSSSGAGATAVRKHYLALIQSTNDVLELLHQAMNDSARRERALENQEIQTLLVFFQSDYSDLSISLLRNLPFYQTISNSYTRLPNGHTVHEVPDSVPCDDLEVLSRVTNSIFLRQAPKLDELYRHIGVGRASAVDFYMHVVLKNFGRLSPEGRLNHLKYVRDYLQNSPHASSEAIISIIKGLPFILDRSGILRAANEFYDPDNEVFECFVPKEKFPPKPFDATEWKGFLKKVGLQHVVSTDHVLQYAQQLEVEAVNLTDSTSNKAKEIFKKSGILVSHLFGNKRFHTLPFLAEVSKIKFVSAAHIKKLYVDIHPSHTRSILTCFNGSVKEAHAALVWSSASLISFSAYPHREELVNMLRIHRKPPHEFVISHVKNIAGRFPAGQEIPSNLQAILSDVLKEIYTYFSDLCPQQSSSGCTRECQLAADALSNIPVILVDRHTLVRGNQLAFKGVWDALNPYMFNIPRTLTQFEHFLKCLGAQESPTRLQYSLVLEAIKRNCKDKQMHPDEIRVAEGATKGLFVRLSRDKRYMEERGVRAQRCKDAQSLANVSTLYLPTEDNYLKPSCQVYVNDTMEEKNRLKDYWNELLIDLTMKNQDAPPKLVELLPNHLKVKKLSSKLGDELSPSCVDKVCLADQNSSDQPCYFIKRYRDIICSPELSDALVRLYKHQEGTPKVSAQVLNDLKRLENNVKVSCMQAIIVRLVTKETAEPIAGSEKDVPTHRQKTPDGFRILIKHGGEANPSVLHEQLSSFIFEITGRHIAEANWRFLMIILGSRDPSEISQALDTARIPRTISDNSTLPKLGNRIPEYFYHLLKNDIRYHFREGEWVAYEVEEEDSESEGVYLFAKIIEQTSQGDGKLGLNSTYKIKIGEDESVEVTKLKLYKFDREGIANRRNEATMNFSDETMELMLYVGSDEEHADQETPPREPVTLEEAKREVAEVLKEIWQLPEAERKSAIKRLIRQWHPDKNPDRVDLATEVTQFLLNEVDRLKEGGMPGYRPEAENSYRPARPQEQSSSDYRHYYHEYTERQRRRQRQRNNNDTEPASKDEAKRWMRQAQADLDAASYLYQSAEKTYYSFTCFHCQQAVEKALKALMFAKGRLMRSDLEHHEVLALAYRAAQLDQSLQAIPILVMNIQGYYIRTRYPEYNRCFFQSSIPAEVYTRENAENAVSNAKEVLQLIEQVLDQ